MGVSTIIGALGFNCLIVVHVVLSVLTSRNTPIHGYRGEEIAII